MEVGGGKLHPKKESRKPNLTHPTQDDARFDDTCGLGAHWLLVDEDAWPRRDTRLLLKPHVPSILSILGKDVALNVFSGKHSYE